MNESSLKNIWPVFGDDFNALPAKGYAEVPLADVSVIDLRSRTIGCAIATMRFALC